MSTFGVIVVLILIFFILDAFIDRIAIEIKHEWDELKNNFWILALIIVLIAIFSKAC